MAKVLTVALIALGALSAQAQTSKITGGMSKQLVMHYLSKSTYSTIYSAETEKSSSDITMRDIAGNYTSYVFGDNNTLIGVIYLYQDKSLYEDILQMYKKGAISLGSNTFMTTNKKIEVTFKGNINGHWVVQNYYL